MHSFPLWDQQTHSPPLNSSFWGILRREQFWDQDFMAWNGPHHKEKQLLSTRLQHLPDQIRPPIVQLHSAVFVSFPCKTLIILQIHLSVCCNCLNKVPYSFRVGKFFENLTASYHYRGECLILKRTSEEPSEMHLRIIYLGKERDIHLSLMSQKLAYRGL